MLDEQTAASPLDSAPLDTASRGAGRRRLVLITSAVLIVVLAVAAVLYGPTLWGVSQQRDASIDTPDEAGGLRRDSSDGALATAEYARSAFATSIELDRSVGAIYSDGSSTTRSVIFAGGTALLWSPAEALDSAFALVADDTGGVQSIRDVPGGELGGLVRCGRTATPEGDLTVCGWADHGSIAVALFPGYGIDEAAPLLVSMRSTMQRRN
jgi:hypothetical protein